MTEWQDLVAAPCAWLAAHAEQGGSVLSSRIRLARNLTGHVFPQRAAPAERAAVLNEVLDRTQSVEALAGGARLLVERLDPVQRQFLGERQLLSPELVESPAERGVVIARDQTLSFLVNEEDHLRIQAIRGGLDLDAAYRAADELESDLDGRLEFAWTDRIGFLTACPTNTGTGMRASVLVHMPAVVLNKELEALVDRLRERRLTIRGFYGEGSAAMGNFFQISNGTTLGVREADLLARLDGAAREIVGWEDRAREALLARARGLLEDRIWRSYGILRHARLLTAAEVLNHTSMLRLGVGLGVVAVPLAVLNGILIRCQPAHVQVLGQREAPGERDAWRAEMVRSELRRCET